ncbi:hypothetical protein WICMUC_000049 [Wickerhamomyces mucosus]|uniref:Nuclear fusion protein KAR5 n=1 Tax=Wickerhamomyces mucosus TaxID=1378264 RepID=A0A9P8PYX8_9ASCO|nr:hypothetical protein WICMUC_000049 [Wickerhamomyces mucosus]
MIILSTFFTILVVTGLNLPEKEVYNVEYYNIHDVLNKYRNLTEFKTDIMSFDFKPEYSDNKCMKEALSPILEQCLKKPINELEPILRSITAAKLSICEFQVSQIRYPETCEGVVNDACVISLEERSQWWTTYSGYYRSIGDICLEESLPFEQDRILEVFFKITEYYNSIFDDLEFQHKMTENFNRETHESFDQLKYYLEDLNNSTKENEKMVKLIMLNFMKEFEKANSMASNITEMVAIQSSSIELELLKILHNIHSEFSMDLDILKEKFIDDLQQKEFVFQSILSTTELNLLEINEITKESSIISTEVNENLKSSIGHIFNLNDSLINIDNIITGLNHQLLDSYQTITDLNKVIENNSIIRFFNFLCKVPKSLKFFVMVFTSSILSGVIFSIFDLGFNTWFRIIGFFSSSLAFGLLIGSFIFHFVGDTNTRDNFSSNIANIE